MLAKNLETGAMSLIMPMMGKGADVELAFSEHDFYRLGGDLGYMANMIIDLGQATHTEFM